MTRHLRDMRPADHDRLDQLETDRGGAIVAALVLAGLAVWICLCAAIALAAMADDRADAAAFSARMAEAGR
ncbi:hypothetical protein OEW28_18770 [Defluviimonas sp. WL0002]|uniref:Uncharacterized protein n=1 Tax=Albidovulum marisflavi TaxID=2984159 RepID=A0ABT2ZIV7_9RHOB|nr:hypothetical protein [Defluviimonas sp. WL0002]MCV2870661.1 hypothetical protein [Defluviimonas sp. WL0002]